MKMYVYYDEVTRAFGLPFAEQNRSNAVRNLRKIATEEQFKYGTNDTNQHCKLYEIGNYDVFSGTVSIYDEKRLVDWNSATKDVLEYATEEGGV